MRVGRDFYLAPMRRQRGCVEPFSPFEVRFMSIAIPS